MAHKETAVLILGSNLGDREANILRAVESIGRQAGEIVAQSSIYESRPWGYVEGEGGQEAGAFLNRAVAVETVLGPEELLTELKAIECELGRAPHTVQHNGAGGRLYSSRIIDIDIIYYGDRVVDLPHLQVPHPLAPCREFVLRPLAEAVPAMRHPVTGMTAAEMLRELKKQGLCDF